MIKIFLFMIAIAAVSAADYGAPAPAPAAAYQAAPVEEPKPVVAAPANQAAPATCQLKKRDYNECLELSKRKENCEDCGTSTCKGCQQVWIRYCQNPVAAPSVEACLERSNEVTTGHENKFTHARKALASLCAEQVCGQTEKKVEVPAPATCQLKKRDLKECERLARQNENCQSCTTSNCVGCQKIYNKYCENPVAARTIEECLERSKEAVCPGHADCHDHARKGLFNLCQEQVCGQTERKAEAPAAPAYEAPRELPKCPPKKPVEDIDVGAIPLPVNHLRGGRQIRDKLRSLDKSLELLSYALKLKGVTVDAPCVEKQHTINLDKFEFPVFKYVAPPTEKPYKAEVPVEQAKPVEAAKPVVAEAKKEEAKKEEAKKEEAKKEEAKKEEVEAPKLTPGLLAWIHKPTVVEVPVETDAKPVAWYRDQCRAHPDNAYYCQPAERKKQDEAKHAEAVRSAEHAAATKDSAELEAKLERAERAREDAKVEYQASKAFGTLTPEEEKAATKKLSQLDELVGAIKVLCSQAKKRVHDSLPADVAK